MNKEQAQAAIDWLGDIVVDYFDNLGADNNEEYRKWDVISELLEVGKKRIEHKEKTNKLLADLTKEVKHDSKGLD